MVSQTKYLIATFLCVHLFTNTPLTQSLSNAVKLETKEEQVKHLESKLCAVPDKSSNRNFKVLCEENPPKNCTSSQQYVTNLMTVEVTCAPGYIQNNMGNTSVHVCRSGQWQLPIVECEKKCDKLKPENVNLECLRNGVIISQCDGNSVLLPGTTVRSMCKSSYYKFEIHSYDFEITCDTDGKWDNHLPSCVPVCGKPYKKNSETLIAYGNPEPNEQSPWHVAIFDANRELICGGTIITEHLIVTAAHCFGSGSHCGVFECTFNYCHGTKCAGIFEVVVGKYHRNYTVQDPQQKTMKIKEIRFPHEGYLGIGNHYAADIAVLILQDSIPVHPQVMPACLNWADLKNRKYPAEGEIGKVVGWGLKEDTEYSPELQSVNLSFISHYRCMNMLQNESHTLSLDKFCGIENRPKAHPEKGDSGGGILFEDKGLYYLQGVVSLKPTGKSNFTMFTDLSAHAMWISSVLKEVEKNKVIQRWSQSVPDSPSVFQRVNPYLEAVIQSVNSLNKSVETIIQSMNNFNKSVTKLNKKVYSLKMKIQEDAIEEAKRVQKWLPQIAEPIECGKQYRPKLMISSRNSEPIAESPWHVAIFDEKKELICGGTIITENLVVSAALCFGLGSPPSYCNGTECVDNLEVVVGKHNRNYMVKDPYQTAMKIKEIYFPQHRENFIPDIALLILQDSIPLSSQVMPACLNWDSKNHKYPSEDALGNLAGWDRTENGIISTTLRSYKFSYISHKQCRDRVPRHLENYVNSDNFCGNMKNGSFSISENRGGGILFEDKGLFYLQGVVSGPAYDSSLLIKFTDLSQYADWISSIRKNTENVEKF